MDALKSIQPGAFAAACGCGLARCVDGCKSSGGIEPEPEPEPEPAPKRGMLTRQEAEEMAEKTSDDIAAARAAEALERERELAAELAQAHADAAALASPLAALDAFGTEQLRRVAAYRDLAEALRVLLDRGDLFKYQKTCAGITAEFALCSRRIMAISENLRTRLAGGATAAAIIDAIQSGEEKKLQLTVALQVQASDLARPLHHIRAVDPPPRVLLTNIWRTWPQLHKAQAPAAVLDILHPQDDGCEGCSDPVKITQMEASIKDLSQQLSQVRPAASLPY